jgi:hypothetical protein
LSHSHAVVWIDHREARVLYFNNDDVQETTVHPEHAPYHMRHKSGSPSGTHEKGAASYFLGVADALSDALEFLVVGPSTAKTEFVTWLKSHSPLTAERLAGVEAMAQASDGEVVKEARIYFKRTDRMKMQAPDHRQG